MNFNYKKICASLLKGLQERQREVLARRFGLENREKETLESIGDDFGITRERVRQIQNDGISKMKPKLKICQKVFQYFNRQLKTTGGLRKEATLLSQLGGDKNQSEVFFLLSLTGNLKRYPETDRFHYIWAVNSDSVALGQQMIDSLENKLKESKQPLSLKDFNNFYPKLSIRTLETFLDVSKTIQRNKEGFFGLKDWPEINPRGVKDKAWLVFKKEKKPLHFTLVAKLIGPEALSQTVHNELIKDPRFVLVGRGTYALKEWGYEEGLVKDIILKVLEEEKRPMSKEEVVGRVLKQRMVKENTILLNLNNKKYFLKTPEGRYTVQSL